MAPVRRSEPEETCERQGGRREAPPTSAPGNCSSLIAAVQILAPTSFEPATETPTRPTVPDPPPRQLRFQVEHAEQSLLSGLLGSHHRLSRVRCGITGLWPGSERESWALALARSGAEHEPTSCRAGTDTQAGNRGCDRPTREVAFRYESSSDRGSRLAVGHEIDDGMCGHTSYRVLTGTVTGHSVQTPQRVRQGVRSQARLALPEARPASTGLVTETDLRPFRARSDAGLAETTCREFDDETIPVPTPRRIPWWWVRVCLSETRSRSRLLP